MQLDQPFCLTSKHGWALKLHCSYSSYVKMHLFIFLAMEKKFSHLGLPNFGELSKISCNICKIQKSTLVRVSLYMVKAAQKQCKD